MTVKNQHYVPRCYLTSFADAKGQVHALDKWKQKTFATKPEGIASETYFYDVALTRDKTKGHYQVFEKALAEFEGHYPPNFRTLTETKIAEGEIRHFFSVWISMQYLRTRGARAEAQAQLNKATNVLFRLVLEHNGIEDADSFSIEPKPETDIKEQILTMFGSAQEKISEILYSHVWLLGINQTKTPLITSDTPVVKIATVKDDGVSYTGFASKGIEIIYPLSPRYVLWIRERSAAKVIEANDGKPMELTDDLVERFNRYQLEESHRFVYSNRNQFANELTILGNRPDLCQPPSYDVLINELSDGSIHIRPDTSKEKYKTLEAAKIACTKDPKNTQARLQHGFSLIHVGLLPEGIKEIEYAVELERTAKTLLALGVASEMCGRIDESAEAFEASLSLDPEDTLAKLKLASAYMKQNRTGEADEILRKVIENGEHEGAANLVLSLSLCKQRKLEDAEAACRKAIEAKFELSPVAERLLSNIHMMQEYLKNKEQGAQTQ